MTFQEIYDRGPHLPNLSHLLLVRDIMPILGDPILFNLMIELMCNRLKKLNFDRILGIESRGFLIGPCIAQKLGKPFSPIRKKGKLPGDLFSVEYELEYGTDILQIQKDGIPASSKCVIIDDLIATGGSLQAAKRLISMSKSTTVAVAVVIELAALEGCKKLDGTPMITLFSY